jgi:signal transduction histidine kinase
VTEAIVRTAGSAGVQFVLVAGLLALATTLPLALPQPARDGGNLTSAGWVAAVIVAAGAVSLGVLHTLTAAGALAAVIAAYRVGRSGAPAVAVVAPFLVLAWVDEIGYPLILAALLPAAALAGVARRTSATKVEQVAAREALAGTLLEHTVRGERARIARELHDVVAHHLSMISVQAETARLTTPGMPAAGAQRLSAIGDTARSALTEMRRLLGVLREDADTAPPDRQPQPGLRELNDLLDEARDAAGTGTRLILRGAPLALDPGVELAVYRIVQEALTNARRHAPGAAVDVRLHYTDSALRLAIRDNGPGPGSSTPPGSHGLLGMGERAAAVGGTLTTGPAAGGGFLVSATLPARPETVSTALPTKPETAGIAQPAKAETVDGAHPPRAQTTSTALPARPETIRATLPPGAETTSAAQAARVETA